MKKIISDQPRPQTDFQTDSAAANVNFQIAAALACLLDIRMSLICTSSRICKRRGKRRVIFGELFQSQLFWRAIFMQIGLFKAMNFGSLQSQLSSNT